MFCLTLMHGKKQTALYRKNENALDLCLAHTIQLSDRFKIEIQVNIAKVNNTMSWFDRLKMLDLPSEETTVTDAVYVDGPRHIIDGLLLELQLENPWITISNINYDRLKRRYNDNIYLATKYLLTQRTDAIIYETSNTNAYLRQHLNTSIATAIADITTQTMDTLMQLYQECCNQMPEYSMNKIVLVLDCRTATLMQWCSAINSSCNDKKTLFLEIIMHLAMLGRRQLHPLLETVVICDLDEVTKQPSTNSPLTLIQFIYRVLQLNVHCDDNIMSECNIELIKSLILDNHRHIEHEYTLM